MQKGVEASIIYLYILVYRDIILFTTDFSYLRRYTWMSTHKRVNQMAHLKQKQISDNSCKAIIIDTILESIQPLTQTELSNEITSIFHILVSRERLNQLINDLCSEGIIYFDSEDRIRLVAVKEAEYLNAKVQETNLRQEATMRWIAYLRTDREVSVQLETALTQALPIFLRSLFVKHGVSSYELLTTSERTTIFNLNEIATNVSKQFEEDLQGEIESLLPSIFQALDQHKVIEYLTHSIDKAVGYISEVISGENLAHIKSALKDLTIYLDTNTIYRLLNLQGQPRYESIRETLTFCVTNGIQLKVSAQTQKELSARLKFDAKVLIQFPTTTNLARAGYKYRTSDNYVSTYWRQARTSHISVEDFIAFYQNYDVLLEAEQIILEKIEVDEEALIDNARCLYEKMSLRDPYHEKSDSGLWHDAYNLAYVQKMQKADAKTAIDTQCLFLTTDQALTDFQREDHELKEHPPIVISPSQLLQLFSFSTPDSGYEETFIKFFASSSLGRSFEYSNNDIQEILSRISHYQGVSPEIAERVLSRQLLNSRYKTTASDEEKEEIIYNSISEELLKELNQTKEQVSALTTENTQLTDERKAAVDLIAKNEELFSKEKLRLQEEAAKTQRQLQEEANARRHAEAETAKTNQQLQEETTARRYAEEKARNSAKYSEAQEKLYVDEKWNKWKRSHLWMFWLSIIATAVIVLISVYLWYRTKDTGYFGILGALAIPILVLPFGCKVFSAGAKSEIRQKYLDDYRDKLGGTNQQS